MIRLLVAACLLAAAATVVACPRLARGVAGYHPLATPSVAELDTPPDADERDAPRFFAERNRVALTVPRDMTLGELVRLYQVDFPHVRRQIVEQAGLPDAGDARALPAGLELEITLTPPGEVPP